MRIRHVSCLAVLAAAPALAQLQLGLRIDPVNSMQWSGSRIFLHGEMLAILDTSLKEIREVWPGPVAGTFAVYSDNGVGMLLGRDVVASGYLFHPAALLRSAEPTAVFALVPEPGDAIGHRFLEYRGRAGARELFATTDPIIDFDVTPNGEIVYMTSVGKITVVQDQDKRSPIASPPGFPAQAPKDARLWVDSNLSEVCVYWSGRLARFDMNRSAWTSIAVDVTKSAVVRTVFGRRVIIEPRLR